MGIVEWLKKDIDRDRKRFKKNPERYIAGLLCVGFGVFSLIFGIRYMRLPSPPAGYIYVTDYYFQGLILAIAGMFLIVLAFLIISTIKIET